MNSSASYTVGCSGTSQEKAFGVMMAKEFGLPYQLGEILHSRGLASAEQAQDFLFPQLSMIPSPDSMKGMREAVACIMEICSKDKPIFIHGDYDADGITATALLMAFFKEIGKKAFFYIPNRLEESYGLSIGSINRLVAQCPEREGVLITVDCGITAVREVEYVRELGLRVVVTDHHEPQETLPRAEAILNPKQAGCAFPCAFLSGVGVAFFLIMALRKAMGADTLNLKKYLDLVALGTVADVVPLVGLNRVLVQVGLEVLSAKKRFGVLSLCECSGLKGRDIISEDISFQLAPRINASGRLGCPQKGVELLLAENLQEAKERAADLNKMNTARKQLETTTLSLVEEICTQQVQAGFNGLMVYHPDCHPGILGILASRMVDRWSQPVLVFGDDLKGGAGETIRGSGRSVKGVNLFQILEQCSQLIERYGGHAMAVGLTVKKENMEQFSLLFDHHVKRCNKDLAGTAQVMVDYRMEDISLLSTEFSRILQRLQPFGEGNPNPVFMLPGQKLIAPKAHKDHLLFQIQGRGKVFKGIGFRQASSLENASQPADLIFQLKQSWFRGVERTEVQALKIITI